MRPASATPIRQGSFQQDALEDQIGRLPRRPKNALNRRSGPRQNHFTELVERTVDALQGGVVQASFDDVQNILTDIRRQYDEVHCEADRREADLVEVRREIRLLENDARAKQEVYKGFSRKAAIQKLEEASTELDEQLETKKVYQHMVERLMREQRILEQKVGLMEKHLERKTREVEKRQEDSRRVHEHKVTQIVKLEELEQDVQMERTLCTGALSDLKNCMQRRKNEVRHREDFERWRYEVALEAATEAFESTAGRYRKIYAIEKLTGNCLQKLTFEQAEQSQATEDGFQKIREVTGLADVMDIVHKFLNRDTEHEQLKQAVREAEARLHSAREAEASRPAEEGTLNVRPKTRGLGTEVAEFEQILDEAHRDHSELRKQLKSRTLLLDSIQRWAVNTGKSLVVVDKMPTVSYVDDIPAFFEGLVKCVNKFLDTAHAQESDARLVKMTSEASNRSFTEQHKLLADKEFIRANCRIPVTVDEQQDKSKRKSKADAQAAGEDERLDQEFFIERDRLKQEADVRMAERRERPSPKKMPAQRGRDNL
mmetsp:Transcript_51510/g.92528  ORF Transcript_51510/g.92528 Transcript_51510/m.92528 type:complete len:543 (+) Transcript_51510:44-1672(+)